MSYHCKFLSSDKAEQLRQIDAAIKQLKHQRFALIQPSRQMVCDRNRSLVRRLDAGVGDLWREGGDDRSGRLGRAFISIGALCHGHDLVLAGAATRAWRGAAHVPLSIAARACSPGDAHRVRMAHCARNRANPIRLDSARGDARAMNASLESARLRVVVVRKSTGCNATGPAPIRSIPALATCVKAHRTSELIRLDFRVK